MTQIKSKKLLIATTNPAKFAEIKETLSDLPVEFVSLTDMGITQSAEETGKTFEENALLKAKFYSGLSGLPAVTDDGGLEIDMFGGEPGVHSHRWIHKDREDTDEELINFTIMRMDKVPLEKRGAQLRVVLAFVPLKGQAVIREGTIRGIIAEKASEYRRKGFPYRSLLYIPEIGKYYNDDELTREEIKKYNHRRRALQELKPFIRKTLSA